MRDQFDIEIMPNGNLRLSVDDTTWDALLDAVLANRMCDHQMLREFTETYWTNGSYEPFDAGDGNPFVGLTSALCIAEDMMINDDFTKEIVGRFWWYPQYETKSPIRELLKKREVLFTLAS